MTKFNFKTNIAEVTTYNGPSGISYVINLGLSFKVENSQDIEFFRKNQRFGEVGLFTPPPVPKIDIDEKLRRKLKKIKGLTDDVVEKIVNLYVSEKELREVIEEYKLDPSIPKLQAAILKSKFRKKRKR